MQTLLQKPRKAFLFFMGILTLAVVIIGIHQNIRQTRMDKELKEAAAMRAILKIASRKEYALSAKCPMPSKRPINYMIIGNGKLKLGPNFKKSGFEDADLLIFHGSDTALFSLFLKRGKEYLRNLANQKEIIITPLSILALKADGDKKLFDAYLDNYKKTGDIFDSNGKKFYYTDELDFYVNKDLTGVVFMVPEDRPFAAAKNYGLGHLLETDFSLNGLENPIHFLEMIQFPKPGGFRGSFRELVAEAKKEFHSKYLKNIISMEPKGRKISRYAFKLSPKKRDKYLPLLKVLRLSKNVYLSSLER